MVGTRLKFTIYRGSIMGKKSQKPAPTPAADAQARIAQQLFRESTPIRQGLNLRSREFLETGDVTSGPAFAGLKDVIESQFGRAREAVIGATPTGGALTSALTDLEGRRASALVGGTAALTEQELGRALELGTGLVPTAVGGLGQAGGIQASAAASAQQASAQKASGTGEAVGRVAAAVITKGGSEVVRAGTGGK